PTWPAWPAGRRPRCGRSSPTACSTTSSPRPTWPTRRGRGNGRTAADPPPPAPGGAGVMTLGYLGLGSNVGDRRANLQAAVEDLWVHGVTVLASSSVYETEPVGEVLDQRPFYNACLRVETELGPERLLDACKAVERALGRVLA